MTATKSTTTPSFNLGQLKYLAMQAGLSESAASTAAAIAYSAESGGNPAATNYNTNNTFDRGLWQINTVHVASNPELYNNDAVYTPLGNAYAMAGLSANGTNWSAWSNDVAEVSANGTLAAAQAVTPEAVSNVTAITQYAPADTNDVQGGVRNDPIGKAIDGIPSNWFNLLEQMGGSGSYSGTFTTTPGEPAPDSGAASAGVTGPTGAAISWSSIGKDLLSVLVIAGQALGGVILLILGIVEFLHPSVIGSLPELGWFLLGAGATLLWSGIRAENSVCVIEQAITGQSKSCKLSFAPVSFNLGNSARDLLNDLIP